MPGIHSSDFAGFIEITPPLSEAQSAYINSRHFPWLITEDGSRIVPHEKLSETSVPAFWMARLIDTFLRLEPAIMKGPVEHRDGAPSFSGHICNGLIQCRKHHNIVVENNRVGKELSWPDGEIEWMNQPEPVFERMKDYRDRVFRQPPVTETAELECNFAVMECNFAVMQYISRLEADIKDLQKKVGVLLEHSDAAYRNTHGL